MRIIFRSVLLLISCSLISGCFAAGVGSADKVPGFLYSQVEYAENGAGPIGRKTGEATCESVLGWIATGDCSVKAAAKAGSIANVSSVSYKVKNILGVYATYTTVVTGN